MDNNLPNQNTSTGGLFRPPEMPSPIPSGKFSAFLTGLKSRKKLVLIIVAVIFLFIVLLYLSFGALKNKFFPDSDVKLPFTNPPVQNQFSSMKIQASKTSFAMSEKIPVSVVASSDGKAVTAFDTVIEYDPQFLTLTERKPPPLQDFSYFGKNSTTLISVSAVQKVDSTAQVKFDNTTLFELEFTPKKPGKTVLKIIYMPGSTSESNLIDSSSEDILSQAAGVEITINW